MADGRHGAGFWARRAARGDLPPPEAGCGCNCQASVTSALRTAEAALGVSEALVNALWTLRAYNGWRFPPDVQRAVELAATRGGFALSEPVSPETDPLAPGWKPS